MLTPWHESRQALRYQLSYFILGQRFFHVLACEVGLTAETPLRIPPERRLDAGFDGFVIRGIPLEEKRPLLEVRDGYIVYTPWHFERSYVDLRGAFADYESRFSAKTRATIRRKVRKFADNDSGEPEFKVYRSRPEVQAFLELAHAISAKTYQERLLHAGLPNTDEFVRSTLADADANSIRAYILFYERAPVSYLFLRAIGDTLVYDHLGYDPRYERLSPGTVLHWLVLESLFSEGRFSILDFTEGTGGQKEQFRTGSKLTGSIYCLRNTLHNRLAVRGHILMTSTSGLLGAALEAIGAKQKLKRFLRR